MAYGGEQETKRGWDLARIVTTILEAVGLLNKGSAAAPAAPEPGDVDRVQVVSSNALNVTRVGGFGAFIGGAGGAAIALFNVDKGRDATAIVVAAYASVGVIVAAALIAVAVIVAADIRARAAIAVATSKAPAAPPAAVSQTDGQRARQPDQAGDGVVVATGHTLMLRFDGEDWEILA
jgi:hypothetical protein